MRHILIISALLSFALPALADDAVLNVIVADYETYALSQDPIASGREGDRKALSRLTDVSAGADLLRRSRYEELAAQLSAIDPAGLSREARLNRDFLAWTLDRQLQSLTFDEARMPFNSDSGFDQQMSYVASTIRLDTLEDAEA